MRTRVWAGFLLIGVLCAALYAAASRQAVEELWWQVVTFGSAGAVVLGVRLHAPANRRPWLLVFASLLTFAVMGLLGVSFWGWADGHVIWPLRDLGLVGGFVLLGVATLSLVRARAPDGDPEGAIDGLIVMIAMAAVLWDTVFGPRVDAGGSLTSQARFVLFPLLQAGVTAAALRLLFLATIRYPSAWMIFGAASLACAGNVLWVVLGGGSPGRTVNLLWILSFLLAGAAALHPSMRHIATPAPPRAAMLPFGRLVVLGIALLSMPLTVLRDGMGTLDGPPVSAVGTALCAGLVLWRLGRLIHSRERASAGLERRAARDGALARISGQALTTTDADAFLIEAAEVVRGTLGAERCAVVPGAGEARGLRAGSEQTIIPLRDWVNGQAALVVDLPSGRRLGAGEEEFLQAVANVLTGAIRRWSVETEMRHQSLHDALTGLPNRVLLLDRLEHALARARRSGRSISTLFVDLDGFKKVNDSLGHNAGDELLDLAAGRLRKISRPQDTLARLAGDEFVIVCDETDASAAAAIAERIVSELGRPFELDAGTAVVGASVGVVSTAGRERTVEELLHDADAAMYRAKQMGRGCVEVFDDELRARLSRLDQVEDDLRGAHTRGELGLVYQPIFALGDSEERMVGAEALVRWHHPRDGFILPGEFIGVAQTRGLIVPLGDWVLQEACRQVALWRDRGAQEPPMSLAVNVSAHELTEPGFVSRVARLLADSGARAEDLILELTETAVTEHLQESSRLIHALHDVREMGMRVALDDFGTGHSSLSHLRTLPLDILKVDRSFVAGLGRRGREHAIVSALAGLTQELGVRVLAEGVETPEQLIAVRALQFDLAQGYHLGRPISAVDLEPMLGRSGDVSDVT